MTDTWRIIIGDLSGAPIANYSALAKDVVVAARLLRPSSVRLRVPADHPDVAGLHEDGKPKLSKMCRTLRIYEPNGDGTWTIRFAGTAYSVQDVGEGDTAWSTLTAFSPMQKLASRFTPVDAADRSKEGGLILKDLIDETNALGFTGIATTGHTNILETTPTRTVRYDRKGIGDAAIELAGAFNGFDAVLRPIHQATGSENGTLAALDIYARAGFNRPDAVFAWGMSPNNVRKIERMDDGATLANALTGLGWTPEGATQPLTSTASTPDSVTAYGRYEAVDQFGDITNQTFLDQLLSEEAALRADGRELVTITPNAGDDERPVPRPWRDFDLGDTVQVWAGEALRGGFHGLQRVYGFGLTLGDDGTATLDQLATSPDDA